MPYTGTPTLRARSFFLALLNPCFSVVNLLVYANINIVPYYYKKSNIPFSLREEKGMPKRNEKEERAKSGVAILLLSLSLREEKGTPKRNEKAR